ncbi:antibiotic biosynthesis monooxygenase [Halomonas sp. I1]|uniref:antibiotic biosynthesis monooxygenase n=1 Tax=Halomonas sp. I1 TaxID=393536 RepID=UPI0028DF91CA|nr:antibiotic biosynthesis monooxygenase [Halomonas sp. I1]MDT8896567.1 antibiotic biosynthesis monooxygenase [Halomonas sp. I1]
MTSSSISSSSGSSITLRIQHRVNPDAIERYEDWLRRIIDVAGRYCGHQGVHVMRPPAGSQDYEIALRFATEDEADRWRHSEERRRLIEEIRPALQQEEAIEIHSGIDYWFTAPAAKRQQPVRWKQWVVTTAVIWPLTMIVPILWQPVLSFIPQLDIWGVRNGLFAATIVGLVVYVVMPRVVRLVAGWMFR